MCKTKANTWALLDNEKENNYDAVLLFVSNDDDEDDDDDDIITPHLDSNHIVCKYRMFVASLPTYFKYDWWFPYNQLAQFIDVSRNSSRGLIKASSRPAIVINSPKLKEKKKIISFGNYPF